MTHAKQILTHLTALLLAFLLLTGVGGYTAFALPAYAAEEELPQYDSIFCIGDSNSMGYGLTGYKGKTEKGEYQDPSLYLNFVENSYPDLVADALDIPKENRNNMSYPALRTHDALRFLGGDAAWDSFNDDNPERNDASVKDNGGSRTTGNFAEQIKYKKNDKKLILLQTGATDVLIEPITEVMAEQGIKLTEEEASNISSLDELGNMDTAALVGALLKKTLSHYEEYSEEMPALIEKIQELNPEADIVLVGQFNPLKDMRFTDDSVLAIGDVFEAITSRMNKLIQEWAEKYNCIYVDINGVETATLTEEISLKDFLTGAETDLERIYHATPSGYEYIARQILNALKETNKGFTLNITVDLGEITEVNSVILDKETVTFYSFDAESHVLTVKNLRTDCSSLTVTGKRSNGNTMLVIYKLSLTEKGYTATRSFTSNNVFGTFSRLLNRITSVMSRIKSLFSGTVTG